MNNFKAFGWDAEQETRVGGVGTETELREQVENLRKQVEHLQSLMLMMEQDRLADGCHIERLAIQVQILRTDAARAAQRIKQLEERG